MATLPDASTLGMPTPQASSSVASYKATTGMEDAGAQSMMRIAGYAKEMAHEFDQEQKKINETRAEDAYNKLAEKRLALTYGENGFSTKKSADAVTQPLFKNYTTEFKTSTKNIADGLDNNEQKALFNRRAAMAGTQYQQDILQHLAREGDVYHKQVLSTSITTAAQESASNPSTVYGNLVRVNALLDKEGMRSGATPEAIAQAKLAASTDIHGTVLNELMSLNQSQQSRAYFNEHKDQIDPTKWDSIRKSLDHVSVKNDSLVLAQELQGTGSLTSQLKTLDGQFKDGKISAEIYDATRTRVEHNWQMQKVRQAESEKFVIGQSQDWLLQNPNKTIMDLPPNLYNGLKNTGHLATISNFAKTGRFDNDPKAWLEFTSMPPRELAAMTPDELFVKYRGKFDDAHLEKAGALMNAAKNPDDAKHANVVTLNETVKRSAQAAGIIPWAGSTNKEQAKNYAAYESEVDMRTKLFEQSQLGGKRPANADEVRKITDSVLMDKVFVDKFGFDPEKPMYQVEQDQLKNTYVKVGGKEIKLTSIPAQQRMTIISKLRQRGLPVNEQAIAELWVKAGSPQ